MLSTLNKTSSLDTAFKIARTWWWVAVIALVTTAIYEHSFNLLKQEKSQLFSKLTSLEKKKRDALREQRLLREEIASQSDPAWLELILKKELGLTPTGTQKAYFKRSHTQ